MSGELRRLEQEAPHISWREPIRLMRYGCRVCIATKGQAAAIADGAMFAKREEWAAHMAEEHGVADGLDAPELRGVDLGPNFTSDSES